MWTAFCDKKLFQHKRNIKIKVAKFQNVAIWLMTSPLQAHSTMVLKQISQLQKENA